MLKAVATSKAVFLNYIIDTSECITGYPSIRFHYQTQRIISQFVNVHKIFLTQLPKQRTVRGHLL